MDALLNFLWGYWQFAKWLLAAIGVIAILLLTVLRRRAKGCAVLILGLYVTLTYYFMLNYRVLDFSLEYTLGAVVLAGLVLASGFYYFFFVRSE